MTNHYILFTEERGWSSEHSEEDGSEDFSVIQCMGCELTHFLLSSWSTMHIDENERPIITQKHYPPSIYRPIPKWFINLDKEWLVYQLLYEVYAALGNESYRLAIMGIRAVLESIMIQCCGDQGSFSKNIAEFERRRLISRVQRESLQTSLEAGHAATHRLYNPAQHHIDVCLDICENIIETLVVDRQNAQRLEKEIPKRGK